MANLRVRIAEAQADRKAPRFSPAGQGTQMIVGADGANDAEIVATSASLYASYDLKRIYYSAFSPIPDASRLLPLKAAPLAREHRLYQADWLYRFYGFSADEIAASMDGGMLDLDDRSEARLGVATTARASQSTSTRPRAKSCCAFRGSARKPSTGSSSPAGIVRCGSTTLRAWQAPCAARGRSSSPPTTARLPSTRRHACARRSRLRPSNCRCSDDHSRHVSRRSQPRGCVRGVSRRRARADRRRRGAGGRDLARRRDRSARRRAAAAAAPPRSACRPAYVRLAEAVVCHRDPERFALLYELLWRITHGERELLSIASDPLVHRLARMEKSVRRDMHKMTAFLRFRAGRATTAASTYVAWFEPEHHILRRVADFLRRPLRRDALVDPDAAGRAALGRQGTHVLGRRFQERCAAPATRWRTGGAPITARPSIRRAPIPTRCGPRCRRNTGATCRRPTLIPGLLAEAESRTRAHGRVAADRAAPRERHRHAEARE